MMKRITAILLTVLLLVSSAPAALAVMLGDSAGYFGDLNDDWNITAADALAALQAAVGKVTFSNRQTVCADVNEDQKVDASDALLILRKSVGKIETFPVGEIYDAYQLPKNESSDPDDAYIPYPASDFTYDTAASYNGAYATDSTADCSFVMDTEGLEPDTVYMVSQTVLRDLDAYRLVVSLQGLVNRDFGRDHAHSSLIVISGGSDEDTQAWIKYMSEEGAVLENMQTARVATWDAFLTTFRHQIESCGLVLWDGNVPATANVAATICGLDGHLPVLAQSPLHNQLVAEGIPVRQSLAGQFTNGHAGELIAGSTVRSTGSAKNDAYRWAMEKYFDRCSANYLAYTLDGACTVRGYEAYEDNPTSLLQNRGSHCIGNHDYLIARRCFFFDLDPYGGESACDDPAQEMCMELQCPNGHTGYYSLDDLLEYDDPACPTCGTQFPVTDWGEVAALAPQGTDAETLLMLLDRRYQRAGGAIGQLMGFPPWWLKYTTSYEQGTRPNTWIEWLFTEIISCYNMAKEADAAHPTSMHNGSLYYKYVPRVEYVNDWQSYDAGVSYSDDTLYYTIYLGDYDSSAWMKQRVYEMWVKNGGDRKRGKIPLTWCYNPNLSYRIPMAFDYIYSHKKENEFFAAGDSGAGYVIPAGLFGGSELAYRQESRPADYTNGDAAWAEYCKKFYDRFGMGATGFIINGSNAITTDVMGMYNTFSPAGSFHNSGSALLTLYHDVPYVYMQNGINSVSDTTPHPATMYEHATVRMEGYNFAAYRTICITPTTVVSIVETFDEYAAEKGLKTQYVEPYTLLRLVKESGQGQVIR